MTSGLLQGQTGWVDGAKDEMVSIVEYIVGRIEDDASNIKVSGTLVSIT